MEMLLDPELWVSLLTLTALEIVLGIDNVIFIAILAGKLPKAHQQNGALGRPNFCHGHAHPAPVFTHVSHEPHQAMDYCARQGNIRP